ncbi:hypothetical protein HPB49_019952 [Dermacentor silvarum]|uniref:Uncharacterized protein n=1 Tax=Dermacentor silvarum TaxID=543639 RepID=A0ACB8CZJ7_DERSI|nr:hypothetical protein HPB49_019952 [Dermacentor silvarum]
MGVPDSIIAHQVAEMMTEPLLPLSESHSQAPPMDEIQAKAAANAHKEGHSQAPPMGVPDSEYPSVLSFLPSPESASCLPVTCKPLVSSNNEMSQKQSDAVHGLVDLGGAEVDFGLEEELATHLLCFIFVGLSTHYRLTWLENNGHAYFEKWKKGAAYKLEFFFEETDEALGITTMSTVLCTRHLIALGFRFVLTGKFSSDEVESLFLTIRQLNGSNDQTDAHAALSSLQKILVTCIIHSSPSVNVGSVIGSVGEATKLAPQPAPVATPEKDIKKLLLPHLAALECYRSVFSSFD